jgi:hypothetical protein
LASPKHNISLLWKLIFNPKSCSKALVNKHPQNSLG